MIHTYKARIYRILVNIAMGLAVAAVISAVAGFFISSNIIRALIFIAVLAGYVWLVIIGNLITIEVDEKTLTVKKGKKTDVYDLATTVVRAELVTTTYGRSRAGSDTSCTLYLTRQGEQEVSVDCELIGVSQFNELLGNLGITGDTVTKLEEPVRTKDNN